MSTADITAILKLVKLLPTLYGELKRSALKLLAGLSNNEKLHKNLIPIYK